MKRIKGWTTAFALVFAALLGAMGAALLGPAASSAQTNKHDHDHGGHGGHAARNPDHWGSVERMHLYLCAFHVAKENPNFQIEAHHYCAPQGGDVHQCVIYDSLGANSKLLGIEYLVSNDTYKTLSDEEKKYWHPHAYEILSGQLVAPDLPSQGDDIFPGLITTWGKTWHTWRDPSNRLPLGEPMLMWSANGDGQIDTSLLEKRDAKFGISTDAIRDRRKAFGFEVPQIPAPKSIKDIGRQWTRGGADEPTKKNK